MKIRTLIALILQINPDNFLGICGNQRSSASSASCFRSRNRRLWLSSPGAVATTAGRKNNTTESLKVKRQTFFIVTNKIISRRRKPGKFNTYISQITNRIYPQPTSVERQDTGRCDNHKGIPERTHESPSGENLHQSVLLYYTKLICAPIAQRIERRPLERGLRFKSCRGR